MCFLCICLFIVYFAPPYFCHFSLLPGVGGWLRLVIVALPELLLFTVLDVPSIYAVYMSLSLYRLCNVHQYSIGSNSVDHRLRCFIDVSNILSESRTEFQR